MCLTEVIWLFQLISRDPKSSPFKSYLRDFSSTKILVLVFCSFMVHGQNIHGDLPKTPILGSIYVL